MRKKQLFQKNFETPKLSERDLCLFFLILLFVIHFFVFCFLFLIFVQKKICILWIFEILISVLSKYVFRASPAPFLCFYYFWTTFFFGEKLPSSSWIIWQIRAKRKKTREDRKILLDFNAHYIIEQKRFYAEKKRVYGRQI